MRPRKRAMLIDTHKAVRDLTEVGVPQEQAERFVEGVARRRASRHEGRSRRA
jgi:hypothetical protein